MQVIFALTDDFGGLVRCGAEGVKRAIVRAKCRLCPAPFDFQGV
jgi:hypothetical protein